MEAVYGTGLSSRQTEAPHPNFPNVFIDISEIKEVFIRNIRTLRLPYILFRIKGL